MPDIRLYYWASVLVVVNDWMCGGWFDPTYARELQLMSLEGVMGMLYGNPVVDSLPEVTQMVFLAWRGRYAGLGGTRGLPQ